MCNRLTLTPSILTNHSRGACIIFSQDRIVGLADSKKRIVQQVVIARKKLASLLCFAF